MAHKGFFDSIKESYTNSHSNKHDNRRDKQRGEMTDWLVNSLSKYLHNEHVKSLRALLVHIQIMHQESHKAIGPIVMADKDWGEDELLLKVLYTGCYIVQAAFLHCVIAHPDLITEERWQELRTKMVEHMKGSMVTNLAEAEAARETVLKNWDRRYGNKKSSSGTDWKVNFGKRRKKS